MSNEREYLTKEVDSLIREINENVFDDPAEAMMFQFLVQALEGASTILKTNKIIIKKRLKHL